MRAFLEARFAPQHLIEFRCIRGGRAQPMWASLSHVEAIEPKLRRLDAEGWDIYCGVNPRAALRSNETSIAEVVAFHADVDMPVGAARKTEDTDCSAIEKTLDRNRNTDSATQPAAKPISLFPEGFFEAEPRLEIASVPTPSIVVDSGHGRHLYWVLTSAVAVTDTNRERLKSINRGLALAVGGDSVCDLSRILRLPGFRNHKPPATDVRLLSSTGIRYPLETFSPFVVAAPNLPVVTSANVAPIDAAPLTPELEARFKAARRKSGEIQRAFRGEIGDGSSDSRYVLVRKLTEHGFAPDEILSIVCSRRWYNCRSKQVRSADSVLRDVRGLLARTISRLGQVI